MNLKATLSESQVTVTEITHGSVPGGGLVLYVGTERGLMTLESATGRDDATPSWRFFFDPNPSQISNRIDEYKDAFLGGLTCDSMDFYNSEVHNNKLFMPMLDKNEPLHIGFFNTGAYQDALSGHGGIKHCLIPSPKQIILDLDDNNNLKSYVFCVSKDFNHNPHSSIFDLTQTQVIKGKFSRVLSWYDNEWGFSNRMCDTSIQIAGLI